MHAFRSRVFAHITVKIQPDRLGDAGPDETRCPFLDKPLCSRDRGVAIRLIVKERSGRDSFLTAPCRLVAKLVL